ncbi:MAG: anaerobic C4-dicarboxylate transporter [Phycisphaerales bacterium]
MVWLEFLVVISAIVLGARVGGAGLGTIAAIGLAVLVFVFGLPPSSPPVTVLMIIIAVVTAAASMQAAGGMDLLVVWAEKALRANPKYITFVAPAVAYVFTFCSGTGHVAYAVLPVIAEVARKAGIRPERPMSISVIASQQAITASPLAAATAALLALLDKDGKIGLSHILMICIPSTFIGCMIGALSVYKMGVELDQDPIYKERLEKGLVEAPKAPKVLQGAERRRALGSVITFLSAAALIVAFGLFTMLRPGYTIPAPASSSTPIPASVVAKSIANLSDPDRAEETFTAEQLKNRLAEIQAEQAKPRNVTVGMADIIQIVMFTAAGIMMLFFGARPDAAIKSPVALAGVVAVVSIVGLGWMGSCFFDGNKETIIDALSGVIKAHPWVFAIGLFGLSVVLFSQASTVAALMPVGIALGLPAGTLIAMFPAVNGYFFLPTYGTIVAAIAFDQTGTTRIGKFVLAHSFMRPGLVATASAVIIGLVLSKIVL